MRELILPKIHEERMNETAGRRESEIVRSLAPHLPSSILKKSESNLWNLYLNSHFHLLSGVKETLSWLMLVN